MLAQVKLHSDKGNTPSATTEHAVHSTRWSFIPFLNDPGRRDLQPSDYERSELGCYNLTSFIYIHVHLCGLNHIYTKESTKKAMSKLSSINKLQWLGSFQNG